MLDLSSLLQVRDRLKLPHLKAVVQYKGKLRKNYHTQEYHNVYEVIFALHQPLKGV